MLTLPDFPSPNCSPRRNGALPDLVVIHYTGMVSADAARDRLCDPVAEVSAHYLITETGHVEPLVPEELRAWHAGAGAWGGVTDVNSRSIGIELANPGAQPFPEAQMAALERLLRDIMHRWAIAPERVIAHSDMAPARKGDPGARFDWCRLAASGLSVWPDAPVRTGDDSSGQTANEIPDFTAAARAFGYPDVAPDLLLAAFRLRFRPWARGAADAIDAALATDLATRFPVDARAGQA